MERLQVILQLVTSQYKKEAREAAQETKKMAGEQASAGSATSKLGDKFKQFSGVIKGFIALKAAQMIGDFVRGSIKAASDLEESINAVEKVFGKASAKINEFGNISASVAGLSKREFNDLATLTGALLGNMGYNADQAADASIRLTMRAADMASVFNTDVSQALAAINSGLKGEANPLEAYGVKLNQAAVKAKAVAMGLADSTAAVSEHAKAQATLQLILEQTNKLSGDFIQNTDSLANAQRRAAAEAENAQARFGDAFARASAGVISWGAKALDSFMALGGDEVAKANLRMQEAIDHINQAIRGGGDAYSALANSLLHLAENGELTRGQFEALAAAAGLMPEQFDKFTDIVLRQAAAAGLDAETIAEMETALRNTAPASDEAVGALGDVTEELDDQAEAAKKARDRLKELRDEYLAAADPIFNAVRALDKNREAVDKLNEVMADKKSTDRDVAEAQLAVAEAAIDAQVALDKLAEGDLDKGIRILADALKISDRQARDLLTTLGLLDGKKIVTTVETRHTSTGQTGKSSSGVTAVRQHGGPVTKHHLYRVGEGNKPEMLLIPGDGGRVFSNRDVHALMAASGKGGGRHVEQHVHMQGTGNGQVDAQRAGAMLSVLRRMEGG